MSSPTSRPPGGNHTPNPALPLSPSPVSIPGPATTHISLACPAPGGFPRPIPAVLGGRSKLQRWSDTSSSSEGSCREDPRRDVGAAPSPTPVSYRAAVLSGRGCADVPRSSARPCVGALPSATQDRQGGEGWQVVVHRRSRKVQRLPRGGVHVDLRGKCYNCLSTFHRAARCRGPCRCFRCLRLGHRAARCPSRPAGGARPSVWQRLHVAAGVSAREVPRPPALRRQVWRRLSPPPLEELQGAAMQEGDIATQFKKRKRRRGRGGLGSVHAVPSSGSEAVAGPRQMLLDSSAPAGVLPKPSCVLDFSEDVARMEVELRRALFVTIVGTRPKVLGREVIEEVARFFQIAEDDMVIHHSKPEDFILFLPDERTATRVLNGGQVFRGPRFSLQFKRWTRFAHASASVLPCLVDVEVRGLPAHTWSRSTVERLLGDSCLVTEVFSEALLQKDFSSFLLRAWCRNPDELQRAMDLIVVEPSFGGHEQRCLSYSVEVVVVPVDRPVGDSPPPSPPPDDDVLDKGGDSQRQFSSSRRSHSHSDDLRRGPIQRRLGPQPPRGDAGGGRFGKRSGCCSRWRRGGRSTGCLGNRRGRSADSLGNRRGGVCSAGLPFSVGSGG